jgi:Pyruvate/2-oxoacid:ferredoxin oxidoreductase delta subunit
MTFHVGQKVRYKTEEQRRDGFFKFVSPAPNTGCWFWLGNHSPAGYAMFTAKKGRISGAHRYSYEIHKGPIPVGLEVDHICNMKGCVNPDHLQALTSRQNQMRTNSPIAQNSRKTHCHKGHEFTPENTVKHSGGGRECRECRKAFKRKYRFLRSIAANPKRELEGV